MECVDIPSSLGEGLSSQVENNMQIPLSSFYPTLSDSILNWLSSFLFSFMRNEGITDIKYK